MVRVIGNVLPAEWEDFWKKCVRWYGLKGVPTFSRLWFQDIRRFKKIRYDRSYFMSVGQAWRDLSSDVKQGWRDAAHAAWDYNRGYRLFSADYIYRLVAGLPVPGDPNLYHQLFGLEMRNPGGAESVFMRRDDKDIVGPLTLNVKFKKQENTASSSDAFKIQMTAYYFTPGSYDTDVDEYVCPAGNVDWNDVSRTFGTDGRKYFHFKLVLTIANYDAIVWVDSLELLDQGGRFFKENFITKRNEVWVPKMLFRKKDWNFSPSWTDTYFKHLYLT